MWLVNTSSTSGSVTYSSNDPNVLSGDGTHGSQEGADSSVKVNGSFLSLSLVRRADALGKGGGGGGNQKNDSVGFSGQVTVVDPVVVVRVRGAIHWIMQ